jgi:hypothetical protein
MKLLAKIATAGLVVLTGCAPTIEDYADKQPTLQLKEYLQGDIEAWGVVQNWRGEVTRHFTLNMNAQWEGNEGTLNERFVYDDGETDTRTWNITYVDEHNFTGTAGDVIGTAHGKTYGNAARINYTMRVPVGDKTYDLAMDDWWYLMDDNHLINKIAMKKFGITVATITIAFDRK